VLATDTVLGARYQLGPIIGRGGGADVFRADDLDSGRPAAVKVLRSATPDDLRRFAVEAQTLGRLDHPAIVRLCDQGEQDGVPYLVLDLIDGEPLSAVLLRGSRPEDEVARIGAVLASALAHAHAFGVVHRDVKPGNVLFDRDGAVHLTDFGIARLTDVASVTATGFVVGTAAYLAPEQMAGETVGPPADIYALGLVLLEAVTGERAFAGSPTEAALARLHRQPVVPVTDNPSLALLLAAMTARDPAARPTAAAVAESLTADATTVLPVASELTAAVPLAAARPTRSLAPVLVAVGVVLLFLFGWFASGDGLVAPATATTPSTPPTTPVTTPTTAAPAAVTVPETTVPSKRGKGKKNDNGD
jgi:serine/threonine protein kinase